MNLLLKYGILLQYRRAYCIHFLLKIYTYYYLRKTVSLLTGVKIIIKAVKVVSLHVTLLFTFSMVIRLAFKQPLKVLL